MTTTQRTARQVARDLANSAAQRNTYRQMARALEALPEQNGVTVDEIARMWRNYKEMEADIDDIIERAIVNDGLTPEDIEAAS